MVKAADAQALLAGVRLGVPVDVAARSAGVSQEQLDEWLEVDDNEAQLEQAKAQAHMKAMLDAKKAAANGDRQAGAWYRQQIDLQQGIAPTDGPPLKPMARAFAEKYMGSGTGVATAKAVGKKGSDKRIASWAASLLRDPRVQAIIEGRRKANEAPPVEVPASAPKSVVIPKGTTAREAYALIIRDPLTAIGHKLRAIEKLEKLEAEEAKRRRSSDGDRLARLQRKVREEIAKKRARDRERTRVNVEAEEGAA